MAIGTITEKDIGTAPVVSVERLGEVLGKPFIHTNADAMKVAKAIGAKIFKLSGGAIYAPDATKLD